MGVYIKLLPGGKFTNGQVNGPAEIYDSINKLIKKGYFLKSKLNDSNGIAIDYERPEYILLQLQGSFSNDVASGSMTRITYNGSYSLDDILNNNLTVPAEKAQCIYSEGNLISVYNITSININITYAKHPTQNYLTNFIINVV